MVHLITLSSPNPLLNLHLWPGPFIKIGRLLVLYMVRVIYYFLYISEVVFPLFMQTASAHSWTCMDLYVFATPYRITWDYYFAAREHTLEIKSWEEEAELKYVCFLSVISLLF